MHKGVPGDNMAVVIIVIAIVAVLYGPAWWARFVLDRYNRYDYFSGNGFDLAHLLLERHNLGDVSVIETDKGSHYDPEKKAVALTATQCGRKTLTAVVVAAHEVGHALQDHQGYRPLELRLKLVGLASQIERVGAGLMMAVPVIGLITRMPATGFMLFLGGMGTLCIPLLVHLITLPTEFDASFRRAMPLLVEGEYIPPEDIPAARRILWACSLTYVASALVGLLNIWRWIRVLRR